jgi:hypothetical protein
MTVRLHHDEVRIDEDLVRQLLRTQLPDLANVKQPGPAPAAGH